MDPEIHKRSQKFFKGCSSCPVSEALSGLSLVAKVWANVGTDHLLEGRVKLVLDEDEETTACALSLRACGVKLNSAHEDCAVPLGGLTCTWAKWGRFVIFLVLSLLAHGDTAVKPSFLLAFGASTKGCDGDAFRVVFPASRYFFGAAKQAKTREMHNDKSTPVLPSHWSYLETQSGSSSSPLCVSRQHRRAFQDLSAGGHVATHSTMFLWLAISPQLEVAREVL